jgi:hypothetical protein
MNIFYLDPDPKTCAEMHISKHVVKMIIEYAQIMSTAHRVLDGEQDIEKRYVHGSLPARYRSVKVWHLPDERQSVLYKATHINHPSAIWCRANQQNYMWLYSMWYHLLQEYTHRYGKVHATARLIEPLAEVPFHIMRGEFFPPTPAMPDDVKVAGNSMLSYHNYYNKNKRGFASWQGRINSRPTPEWYTV